MLSACGVWMPCSAADWPQWGGTDQRNMASNEKNLPARVSPDEKSPVHLKWSYRLGTHTYGNVTVSQGRVFVGTNDKSLSHPHVASTNGGLVVCLNEADGTLLWQLPIPRYVTDKSKFNFDDAALGVCSSLTLEGDFAYGVSSRGEVLCLDVKGQADGNAGPFLKEAAYMAGDPEAAFDLQPTDGDIVWAYDMLKEIPSWPQDASSCAILIYRDYLIVGTSNGVDSSHSNVPFPDAPSLLCLDKRTGKLIAADDEKFGRTLFHGQWSSPSMGCVNGRDLIFYGGGDGICYAFEPPAKPSADGQVQTLKKVWWCDCNPPEYKVHDGKPFRYEKKYRSFYSETRGIGPSEIIATPVFYNNRVYVAVGQDTMHGRGAGALTCIDAAGQGDISSTGVVWRTTLVDRSLSTVSIADGLLYVADYSGNVHCFDADSGQRFWVHPTKSPLWATTLVAADKVYIGTENKNLWVLKAGKELQVLEKNNIGDIVYNGAVAANGALYIATEHWLHVFQQSDGK